MILDHIGIAVKDISLAIKEYEFLGFKLDGILYKDDKRNIKIQFMMNMQGNRIELIETMDLNKNSPVKIFLNKSNHVIYHTCYVTNDIGKQVEIMLQKGYILIAKPDEAIAFQERKVCFLLHKTLGIIELVEYID